MKPLICISLLLVLFSSCKKEIKTIDPPAYLTNVKTALKDSLSPNDYAQLDFSKALLDRVDSIHLNVLRIPFKGKQLRNDFLIVKTNDVGKIERGKIVHLEGKENQYGEGKIKRRKFDGSISISSLNRKEVLNSAIENGYIAALHPQSSARQTLMEDNVMPEVVIVCYISGPDTFNYSTWLWLNSIIYLASYGGPGGGSNGYYYGSADGNYDYGGGGGGDYAGVTTEQPILVDADLYADKNAIDIEQYVKCFDNIPDAGAQCEVGIYADIPVDSDPNKIFDFSTGSPGHTFIQIKKTSADGTQSVVQNIGFYPQTGWKVGLTDAPVDAKFVDDSQHEFNAAYTKTLTPEEFRSTVTEIRYLKNMQYDIDNYNCTDWALAVFNKQGYGLDIPLYDIPGTYPSAGTSMPQGIYNKLQQMKNSGDPHADKIQIGFYKGYVTSSDGPCN